MKIVANNIWNNVTIHFSSVDECAKYFKVKDYVIENCIKYQLRVPDKDGKEWYLDEGID